MGVKNDVCKGFRKHNWKQRRNTNPDPKVDHMAAFYLGWIDVETICVNCRLIK